MKEQILCEICNKPMPAFTHLRTADNEILIVCFGCRDKEEARADFEYQRQKEEGNEL